jgi:phosphoribosylaminoimidazolecarboxamide formyltransferase / IMP cyclohydrolase
MGTMRRPVTRALLSVWDKQGLEPLAKALVAARVTLVSSGGTANALASWDLPVTRVTDVTGAPEILGGRVKTLHPAIHGGILAKRGDPSHEADMAAGGIEPIDLVVCNLYPFEVTVARPDVTRAEAIDQIDIGGPAMIRAAAKNHAYVGVVTDPAQYDLVAAEVAAGGLTDETREALARAAFSRTAAYDAAIVEWLARDEPLPETIVLPLERHAELRYGENPHQRAAIYHTRGGDSWWTLVRQVQGKEMSFNNYADTQAAWELVNALDAPACVIVKHTNPCGAAIAATLDEAFEKAWQCDPLSAFGGVVAVNRALDGATGGSIAGRFVEVVIAPSAEASALDALAGKESLRLLEAPPPSPGDWEVRHVERGLLVQDRDDIGITLGDELPEGWGVATRRAPTPAELGDLRFAWIVAAHTKSNAVVVATGGAAVGVGAGDQSRVGAAERALARAGDRAAGAVAASDAFLPFRDALDLLADAGVTALAQPGGSRRDAEVIAAADERGMAIVLTHRRHFRH